jgi:hypothetical protein
VDARPVQSPWGRIPIETLDDNVAAKMNALVGRGAPRDFVDIKAVVDAGLMSVERCWQLWLAKNRGRSREEGRLAVEHWLAAIVARAPLERLPPDRRGDAAALRAWYHDVFTAEPNTAARGNDADEGESRLQ